MHFWHCGTGHATKLGPGVIRHLELQAAYLKECVRNKLIHLEKMPSKENTSDILTKHYSAEVIRKMERRLEFSPWG